jgi:hypothetical protein
VNVLSGNGDGIKKRKGKIMRKYLTGFLCVLVGLYASSASAATYNFVKTGTTETTSPPQITFENMAYNNGGKVFFNTFSPIIAGENLYAEDLVKVGGQWYCYHGGWLTAGQTNDKIYLGVSDDGEPAGTWSPSSQLLIDNGVYTHVNDPSVQKVGSAWYMVYTTYAGATTKEWINYSTSSDGINWTPNVGSATTEIALTDPLGLLGTDTLTDIARPSLVKDGSQWLLYFDGIVNDGGVTKSYCATSTQTTPSSFTLAKIYDDVAGFPGFFEPDVERRPDGSFIAVYQRNYKKIFLATSADGLNFTGEKEIYDVNTPPLNGPSIFADNPGLLYDAGSNIYQGIMFGYTTNAGLTGQKMGYAPAQWIINIVARQPLPDESETTHVYAASQSLSQQRMYIFGGYTRLQTIRLFDPVTGLMVHEQDFSSAAVDDLWELQVTPGPTYWIGNLGTGDGINWNSWGNWAVDGVPSAPPTAATAALAINVPGYGPTISTAGAEAKSVEIGTWGWDGTLTVESAGTLAVSENVDLGITTGNTGTLTNSGDIDIADALYIGDANDSGAGTVNMNGGTLDVAGTVHLAAYTGISHINLDGGTITAGGLDMDGSPQDTIDITAGTFIAPGNDVGGVNWLAGLDRITAYGGWGIVNASTDGTNITVTASPGAYNTAPAMDVSWLGSGYAKDWDRAVNWFAPTTPDPINAVPRAIDNAIIAGAAAAPNIPIIMSGQAAVANDVIIGAGTLATLIVDGGTLTCNELSIGWAGYAHLQLNAGTVTAVDLELYDAQATMDFEEGVLIITGDEKAEIDWMISIGKITAYDGAGCVWVDYSVTNPGKTTVKAYDAVLAGDLNGDCWVNLKDFAILAGNWLESSL